MVLKPWAFWEVLYNSGYLSMFSFLHERSKMPRVKGGRAVKIWRRIIKEKAGRLETEAEPRLLHVSVWFVGSTAGDVHSLSTAT